MVICDQLGFNLNNINELAIIITVLGYVVVFIALAVLVVVIGRISVLQDLYVRIKLRAKGRESGTEEEPQVVSISADENAAICTALYLYFTELHDEEKYVMTVKKVSRNYSPWSSKIYGVMNFSKRG
jgi:Na+-transporting methylmalonyl-CoA/oxaloacetate decarboxylase gamma subunit